MLLAELALQAGKNLISYYPTFIPCLHVFYYESLMSLQVSLRLELPVLGQDAHLCCCQLWRAANFLQRCEPQYRGEDKKSHRAGPYHPFSLNAFRDLSLLTLFDHVGGALALCAVTLGATNSGGLQLDVSCLSLLQWLSSWYVTLQTTLLYCLTCYCHS